MKSASLARVILRTENNDSLSHVVRNFNSTIKKEPLEKIEDVEEALDITEKKHNEDPLKYSSNTRARKKKRESSKSKAYKSLVKGQEQNSKSPNRRFDKTPPRRKTSRISRKSNKAGSNPKQPIEFNKNSFRGKSALIGSSRQFNRQKNQREFSFGVETGRQR